MQRLRQSSVRLGWGAARHALILWLKHGVLRRLEHLIGHRALLLRKFGRIHHAPSARERVLALAEALRGVKFHLENWVLADAPSCQRRRGGGWACDRRPTRFATVTSAAATTPRNRRIARATTPLIRRTAYWLRGARVIASRFCWDPRRCAK